MKFEFLEGWSDTTWVYAGKSKKGELSIFPKSIELLSYCLHMLPKPRAVGGRNQVKNQFTWWFSFNCSEEQFANTVYCHLFCLSFTSMCLFKQPVPLLWKSRIYIYIHTSIPENWIKFGVCLLMVLYLQFYAYILTLWFVRSKCGVCRAYSELIRVIQSPNGGFVFHRRITRFPSNGIRDSPGILSDMFWRIRSVNIFPWRRQPPWDPRP